MLSTAAASSWFLLLGCLGHAPTPHPHKGAAHPLQPIANAFNSAQRNVVLQWVPATVSAPVSGPDASGADATLVESGLWVAANQCADLGPSLRARNVDLVALLPGLHSVFSVGGLDVAVPVTYRPQTIWVDTVQMADLGLDLPPPGWSLDDFAAFALAVAQSPKGNGTALGGYTPPWLPEIWGAWAFGFGAELVQDGQIVLDDPACLAGLDRFATLLRSDGMGYDWPMGWTQDRTGRLTDYPAAVGPIQFLHFVPTVYSDPSDFTSPALPRLFAALAIPSMPAPGNIPLTVYGLAVPPRSPHTDQLAEFLAWMLSPAGQTVMRQVGYPSVVPGDATAWAGSWAKSTPGTTDAGAFDVPATRFHPIPWQISAVGAPIAEAVRSAIHAAPAERRAMLAAAAADANRTLTHYAH